MQLTAVDLGPAQPPVDDVGSLCSVAEQQASQHDLVFLLRTWCGEACSHQLFVVEDSCLRHVAHAQAAQTGSPGEVHVVTVEKERRLEPTESVEDRCPHRHETAARPWSVTCHRVERLRVLEWDLAPLGDAHRVVVEHSEECCQAVRRQVRVRVEQHEDVALATGTERASRALGEKVLASSMPRVRHEGDVVERDVGPGEDLASLGEHLFADQGIGPLRAPAVADRHSQRQVGCSVAQATGCGRHRAQHP
jgi:hypothetical protein